MVVIVDLDDEPPTADSHPRHGHLSMKPLHHSLAASVPTPTGTPIEENDAARPGSDRPNPNVNGFSAALSCYPIARQLAGQVDLNTMHSLSRTCRQFRANLLEYRDQLVRHTLHCHMEDMEADGTRPALPFSTDACERKLTHGKVGKCARDMVAECQRCGTVVCRNCTMKPPATPVLRRRHRRLCRLCSKAPLHLLTTVQRPRSPFSGSPSPPITPDPHTTCTSHNRPRPFIAPAFERSTCCCTEMVWLCQPCGQDLKNADTMYVRAWSWRTRYSHYLGGVGTGAGEGNEGVECGRGPSCLAAKVVEHEVECDAQTLASLEGSATDRWKGTSYLAQEVEGIGGTFKLKAKKQVFVGECVKIYKDEEDKTMEYLEREVDGKSRSWCAWCEGVILGEKDVVGLADGRLSSSNSSSASLGG